MKFLLKLLYGVTVTGLDHYEKAGKRVLIIANHTSFLDAVLLAVFLPKKLTFAVNSHIAKKWYMWFIRPFITLFPLDPTNPMATKAMIERLRQDSHCVIFPEGRITVTGSLMKIYEGPGLIADKSAATVVPIRIDGPQYTCFSRLKGKVRFRLFPKISLTILEPQSFQAPDELKGRKRRLFISNMLYDVMSNLVFETSPYQQTLFSSLLDARVIHGTNHSIIEDVKRSPLTYGQLITRSQVLGRVLARHSTVDQYVGLLLPNVNAAIVSFFGLQAHGRVPAMLNYSTGVKNVISACKTAQLTHIITSRNFIIQGKLEPLEEALKTASITLLYLEDLANELTWRDKTSALASRLFPALTYRRYTTTRDPEKAAVILFTSGSEGVPKAVVLSHRNLQANRYQLSARIDFGPSDSVFNALPIFHSFGLTGGMLLPVLSGVKTFLYPSPLHYRVIPELIYDSNATILFGTDTFLHGYGRVANPYDFYSLRYVFAGAEKVRPETRKQWSERFGLRILEGYGATETAPGLSMNTPMHNQAGTVGRLLPVIEHKLEPVPGIDAGGRLYVKGPNIMMGYLLHDAPGKLQPPKDGWYDTGDIVDIDAEGFVTIKGRAKRFAKIAGEMVSLTAVEQMVAECWPDHAHAVVSLPDPRKGEQLVLLTQQPDAERPVLSRHIIAQGATELSVPKTIHVVETLPILGTGKIDYVAVKTMAEQLSN